MIQANLYTVIEPPNPEDVGRINAAINLLTEIKDQVAKCTSTYDAYEIFDETIWTLTQIRDGKWMY